MKFLRINMTTLDYTAQDVPVEYTSLGGRGITSKLLTEEVDPKIFALGKNNKIIIAPGLLTGTMAPSSGRLSIGAKSPLTGTIKESNAGGTAGQYLAGHGIKALIIEGQPIEKHCWVLVIDGINVKFEKKDYLSGLGNYSTVEKLKSEYGKDCSIISIGPAGELGFTVATLAVTDIEDRPTRHAARGGLGAVMGSKGIKALVIRRPLSNKVQVADEEKFRQVSKNFARELIQNKKSLTKFGTAVLVNVINEVGGLPTRNFTTGYNENAGEISGENLEQLCTTRGGTTGHPCSRGCVIRCSNVFHDKEGKYVTAGLEFETIALIGSNCGLNNLDAIAQLDRLCDDIGVDTMDIGGALGVSMEAGLIPFGDFESMRKAIENIVEPELGLGNLIGHGAAFTGRAQGVERVPVVKGQTMSAYDPRTIKGTGVTYATSTMGADHTAGNALPGRGGLDCKKPEGQIELSKSLQVMSMVCDMLGMCLFIGPLKENMPILAELVTSFTGRPVNTEELLEQATNILRAEAGFNKLSGIGVAQNDLPLYFREEPLPNNGLVFDVCPKKLLEFEF